MNAQKKKVISMNSNRYKVDPINVQNNESMGDVDSVITGPLFIETNRSASGFYSTHNNSKG